MGRKYWRSKCSENLRSAGGIKGWKGWKYLLCVVGGVVFFLAAEAVDQMNVTVENGVILRNSCGQGETVYELYVDGLRDVPENSELDMNADGKKDVLVAVELSVPEQELTKEQFEEQFSEIGSLVCERILGENLSLQEVRFDLDLMSEISEFGVDVFWESDHPEIIGADGAIYLDSEDEQEIERYREGVEVCLTAKLVCGQEEMYLEIPIVVYPVEKSLEERFLEMLEAYVLENPEQKEIILPSEFEGRNLTYRSADSSQNFILVIFGVAAAVILFFKEKEDLETERKKREISLTADYPDLVYEFLILTGAGYSAKRAWKKLTEDAGCDHRKKSRPLYQEMKISLNQMETGTSEIRAYLEFGNRCGLRSYMKFASLLETSVRTGGKNLRKLLEEEVEEAFQMRADMARRNGEMASSKLLLPMFAMLAVVMVMVAAPAFLGLNG